MNEYKDDLARYPWADKASKTKGGRSDIDAFVRDQHNTYLGQIDQARYSQDGFELVFYGDNLMQVRVGCGVLLTVCHSCHAGGSTGVARGVG